MTHSYLVERAAKWLRGTHRCNPVLAEHKCFATSESPDAFGVNSDGSIVVECKVSVADFYADQRKQFRKNPEMGMGRVRYYLTPKDLINKDRLTLAPGWGLAEVRGSRIRVIRESDIFQQCSNAECLLMRSAWLWGRGFVK